MAELTSTGLVIDRFNEILEEINTSQKELIDPNIDTSSETLLGQYTNIVAERLSSLQDLIEVLYDARALGSAEGKALDDLVQLLSITRNEATKTSGNETFTGSDGTVIPSGTVLTNPLTKDRFVLSTGLTLDSQACYSCVISINNLVDSTDYPVTIDGNTYIYNSVGVTEQNIVEGLQTQIAAATGVNFTATEDDVSLTITSVDGSDIDVSVGTTNMAVSSVSSRGFIQAEEAGVILAAQNTVIELVGSVSGITSVTNDLALTTGSLRETDEALRTRAQQSGSNSGVATVEAIRSALTNDAGITNATVEENTTGVVVDGIDPYSFRALVQGTASDEEVARIIWDTKPAGVGMSGNTSVVITDSFGGSQTIKFTRPTGVVIDVDITYELNPEETLTGNINDAFTTALAAEFDALSVGGDVIPKRFYGAVYSNVSGLSSIVLNMAINPAVPTTENLIAIGSDEIGTLGTISSTQI